MSFDLVVREHLHYKQTTLFLLLCLEIFVEVAVMKYYLPTVQNGTIIGRDATVGMQVTQDMLVGPEIVKVTKCRI